MKPYIPIALISLILIASGSCGHKNSSDNEYEMTVDVARATVDSVMLYRTYPGVMRAADMVDIVGRVSGTFIDQYYNNGDEVKKGQLLFAIEDSKYRDAVQEAQAALVSAQSSYEYAKSHYAAMEKALESDAVSQMEVKQALSVLQQSEASIKTVKAQLATAKTNLSYCRIYAPFNGRVTAGIYSPGAYINGEASPVVLASIYADDKIDAYFSIDDASFIRSFTNHNNRDIINYDSIPLSFEEKLPHKYFADLRYISPEVNTETGTMALRARVENKYGELRDGMYVTVSLPYKVDPKAVLVKDASISTDQLGKFVYVLNDSNKVVYTPITVGDMANDSMRVVLSGISGGTPYVTKAMLKVRTGMEVKPRYVK